MTRNEKGISLLEMLLVLAIGAAIIMAAVRYFTITNRNARVTQAISQIKMLTKASYEWLSEQKQQDFSSVNGGVTVSLQQLIDANLIKDTEHNKKDPWGGDISIAAGSDPSRVRITLSHLPQKACKNLARRLDNVSQTTIPPCSAPVNNYSGEF